MNECIRDGCEKERVGHSPERKPKYDWFCEDHVEQAKNNPNF